MYHHPFGMMNFIEHSIVLWLIYLPPEEIILSEFLIWRGQPGGRAFWACGGYRDMLVSSVLSMEPTQA